MKNLIFIISVSCVAFSCGDETNGGSLNDVQAKQELETENIYFTDKYLPLKDIEGNSYFLQPSEQYGEPMFSPTTLFIKQYNKSEIEQFDIHTVEGVQYGGTSYSSSFAMTRNIFEMDTNDGSVYVGGLIKSENGVLIFDSDSVSQYNAHFYLVRYADNGKIKWIRTGESSMGKPGVHDNSEDFKSSILDADISNDSLIYITGYLTGDVYTRDSTDFKYFLDCVDYEKNLIAPSYSFIGAIRKSNGTFKSFDAIIGRSYFDMGSANRGEFVKIIDNKLITSGTFQTEAFFPKTLSDSSNCHNDYLYLKGAGRKSKYLAAYDLTDSNRLLWANTFQFNYGEFDGGGASINVTSVDKGGIIFSGSYNLRGMTIDTNQRLSLFGHSFKFLEGNFIGKISLEGELLWMHEDEKNNISIGEYKKFNSGDGHLYSLGLLSSDGWYSITRDFNGYKIIAEDKRRPQPFIIKRDENTGEVLWVRPFKYETHNEFSLANFSLNALGDKLIIKAKNNIILLQSNHEKDKYDIILNKL